MALYNDENNFGLLRELALKLRRRNAEQTVAFRDVFKAHEGLLQLNAKLTQQTVDQDKVNLLDNALEQAADLHTFRVVERTKVFENRHL